MRASSITRSSPVTARTSAAVTTSVPPDFSTTMCRSANAATWGRWVTTTTCAWRASSARRRPTSTAALPPTPASTSSKTNVGGRMAPDPGAVARAHSGTVDDALAWASWAGLRLLELEQGEDRTASLREQIAGLEAELARLADAIGVGRSTAAERLAEAVTAELAGLAMPAATFRVLLTPTAELGPWGGQDVEMLLAAHAGAPALPLGHGASGGELSRVMLA